MVINQKLDTNLSIIIGYYKMSMVYSIGSHHSLADTQYLWVFIAVYSCFTRNNL